MHRIHARPDPRTTNTTSSHAPQLRPHPQPNRPHADPAHRPRPTPPGGARPPQRPRPPHPSQHARMRRPCLACVNASRSMQQMHSRSATDRRPRTASAMPRARAARIVASQQHAVARRRGGNAAHAVARTRGGNAAHACGRRERRVLRRRRCRRRVAGAVWVLVDRRGIYLSRSHRGVGGGVRLRWASDGAPLVVLMSCGGSKRGLSTRVGLRRARRACVLRLRRFSSWWSLPRGVLAFCEARPPRRANAIRASVGPGRAGASALETASSDGARRETSADCNVTMEGSLLEKCAPRAAMVTGQAPRRVWGSLYWARQTGSCDLPCRCRNAAGMRRCVFESDRDELLATEGGQAVSSPVLRRLRRSVNGGRTEQKVTGQQEPLRAASESKSAPGTR